MTPSAATTWPGWTCEVWEGVLTRRLHIGCYYIFTLREVAAPEQMLATSAEKRMVPVPAADVVLFQERDAGWAWYLGWCVRCGGPATRCVSYQSTALGYGVEEVVAELLCEDCGAWTRVDFDKDTS